MKPMIMALALCGFAVACVPEFVPAPGLPPAPVENACGADALQGLVGQPASVLETMRFGTETRIIRPGTAVTMDYRPDRLNIDIDAREWITRVYCS